MSSENHRSESTLGQDQVQLQGRRGHMHRTPCPWADPLPTDAYAPLPCKCKCRDGNSYMRRQHEYLHESPKGTRCIWCGRLRAWEPL